MTASRLLPRSKSDHRSEPSSLSNHSPERLATATPTPSTTSPARPNPSSPPSSSSDLTGTPHLAGLSLHPVHPFLVGIPRNSVARLRPPPSSPPMTRDLRADPPSLLLAEPAPPPPARIPQQPIIPFPPIRKAEHHRPRPTISRAVLELNPARCLQPFREQLRPARSHRLCLLCRDTTEPPPSVLSPPNRPPTTLRLTTAGHTQFSTVGNAQSGPNPSIFIYNLPQPSRLLLTLPRRNPNPHPLPLPVTPILISFI